ncbi:MAG: hypothetical protein IKN66_07680 [Ruminococcus sp.]|nr:hypothetical protein [Ruminococcus sp.]
MLKEENMFWLFIFEKIYGIMNASAFIIIYFKALADTLIGDQLPAYRVIIS